MEGISRSLMLSHKLTAKRRGATFQSSRRQEGKGIMTTEDKTKPATDLFEQAIKNYEQALKTGLKLQEDSLRMWTGLVNQPTAPQDLQKRVKALTDEIIPQTQKAIEDNLKLVEQNSRSSIELLKKAATVAQATTVQDAQSKFLGFCEASLNAVRDTTVAVTQANAKAVESWVGYVRKSAEPVATAKA
jgi:hypothetical protein